jgi:NAD-dependent oxidoreductase involved in siderophore biosynthesis
MPRRLKEHELASPVDLPGEPIEDGDPLAWTTVTIAVAALVLLFANAGTLAAWVDEKPVSQQQQRASDLAAGWKAMMDAVGVTAPRDALHARWKKVQAKRFGEEAPAGTQ